MSARSGLSGLSTNHNLGDDTIELWLDLPFFDVQALWPPITAAAGSFQVIFQERSGSFERILECFFKVLQLVEQF